MNDILLTNIFFLITALATVVLVVVVVVLLVYVIRLVKKLQSLADIITDEAEKIKNDIDGAREVVQGATVVHVLSALFKKLFGKK